MQSLLGKALEFGGKDFHCTFPSMGRFRELGRRKSSIVMGKTFYGVKAIQMFF